MRSLGTASKSAYPARERSDAFYRRRAANTACPPSSGVAVQDAARERGSGRSARLVCERAIRHGTRSLEPASHGGLRGSDRSSRSIISLQNLSSDCRVGTRSSRAVRRPGLCGHPAPFGRRGRSLGGPSAGPVDPRLIGINADGSKPDFLAPARPFPELGK